MCLPPLGRNPEINPEVCCTPQWNGPSEEAIHNIAKAGGPGFDSWWLPWVFLLPADLLMLMGLRVYGALVQFGCYQLRRK